MLGINNKCTMLSKLKSMTMAENKINKNTEYEGQQGGESNPPVPLQFLAFY